MPLTTADIWHERIVCSIAAAGQYHLPAVVMLAVASREGGQPGLVHRNTNGTYDLGYMQLNTAYLAQLARYGVPASAALARGCYSYDLAAWRIAGHLAHDRGDYWTRVANYHSRSPVQNAIYSAQLIRAAVQWNAWLQRAAHATQPLPSSPSVATSQQSPGFRLTSGFGQRVHPVTGRPRDHDGIDIAAPYGTVVNAAIDGKVTRAGPDGGYGLMVEIAQANGLSTRYAHLSRITVTPGKRITRGSWIGNVGTSGLTTGPHLHYEVRFRGLPVNPLAFVQ